MLRGGLAMKVKLFKGSDLTLLEKEINKFVNKKGIEVQNIELSLHGNVLCVLITYWVEDF